MVEKSNKYCVALKLAERINKRVEEEKQKATAKSN